MIIGVAVKFNEIMVCQPKPSRHHSCYRNLCEILDVDTLDFANKDFVHGFYTDKGQFLDRKKALQYCIDNHIPHSTQSNLYEPMLFSEDLW